MSIEAMKQAVDALEYGGHMTFAGLRKAEIAAEALRTAIEQAERQEPDSAEHRLQVVTDMLLLVRDNLWRGMSKSIQKLQARSINEALGLEGFLGSGRAHTSVEQAERLPLTEEELSRIYDEKPRYHCPPICSTDIEFARAIEAAHGIGGGK